MTDAIPKLAVPPSGITHAAQALRLVLYGEGGVGKTTLGMTFPRPFVLNTDDGLVAVTALRPGEDLGQQIEVSSYTDLQALPFYLREHRDDFDTVLIDSYDELAFILTDELIARHDAFKRQKEGRNYNPNPVFEMIPEQPEYQANQRQLHTLLNELRKLKKHVVVTVGVRNADPPKWPKRGPNVAPSALGDLVRWASIIGELVIADEGHALMLRNGDPARVSKTRFAAMTPYVLDPTYDKLMTLAAMDGKD